MSELTTIDRAVQGKAFRHHLLLTVSVLILLVPFGCANADETDHPTVWIEVGGQLERLSGSLGQFSPDFLTSITQPSLLKAIDIRKPASYGLGEEGKLSFQPHGSEWIFSAAVRYGRSQTHRYAHHQTPNAIVPGGEFTFTFGGNPYHRAVQTKYPTHHVNFADTTFSQSEQHALLDFQVGKDVGLGIFGRSASSVLSGGIRIAQFASKSSVNMHVEPDVNYPTHPNTSFQAVRSFNVNPIYFHDYIGLMSDSRSFHGIGPSIAWSGSIAVQGDKNSEELTVDWTANASVLFGRQKVREQESTAINSYKVRGFDPLVNDNGIVRGYFQLISNTLITNARSHDRVRSATVPNLGGSVGLSYRVENFRAAFGYRADFFFGAIDSGNAVQKSQTLGFHGPFATVSVGLP